MTDMARLGIGMTHFAEVDWDAEPEVPEEFRALARRIFPNLIIVAGNYNQEKAKWVLDNHYADRITSYNVCYTKLLRHQYFEGFD